jgi:hypothetical protein
MRCNEEEREYACMTLYNNDDDDDDILCGGSK